MAIKEQNEYKQHFGGLTIKAPEAEDKAIKPPSPPYYLRLWFELQRWPGHLIADGGLYDQPDWTWEMIDLAGVVFTARRG